MGDGIFFVRLGVGVIVGVGVWEGINIGSY